MAAAGGGARWWTVQGSGHYRSRCGQRGPRQPRRYRCRTGGVGPARVGHCPSDGLLQLAGVVLRSRHGLSVAGGHADGLVPQTRPAGAGVPARPAQRRLGEHHHVRRGVGRVVLRSCHRPADRGRPRAGRGAGGAGLGGLAPGAGALAVPVAGGAQSRLHRPSYRALGQPPTGAARRSQRPYDGQCPGATGGGGLFPRPAAYPTGDGPERGTDRAASGLRSAAGFSARHD